METENKNCDSAKVNEFEQNQLKTKKFAKNVLMVLFSNALSLFSGLLVGFLIPLIMGVDDYGYYKAFTLYASYIGIFHFGFIDGIYLYFAGKKYDELDREQFRSFSKFILLFELIVSLIVTAISIFFIGNEYSIIILFVAIDVLAVNITTYYEFISQITMRFKQLSLRNVIRTSLTIISVLILFLLFKFCEISIAYYYYVSIIVFINYVLAIWYIISYRDITFGKRNSFKNERDNILNFFKSGFPLLLSNLVVQLIFLIDQQFVNIFFENDVYSIYAFAYTMINLITIATGAVSTVIYPTLKTMNCDTIKRDYSNINSVLITFVSFCLIAYYLLVPFVNHFLPNYSGSLEVFKIILPGVVITSSISVVKYNCYKTFNLIKHYFWIALIILIVGIISDAVVYLIYKNTVSISIVSIFVLLLWYFLVEYIFARRYKVGWIRNFVYIIFIICAFYGTLFIPNIIIAALVYLMAYLLGTYVFFYKNINKFVIKFAKKVGE